jgi:hypothetical protein
MLPSFAKILCATGIFLAHLFVRGRVPFLVMEDVADSAPGQQQQDRCLHPKGGGALPVFTGQIQHGCGPLHPVIHGAI